AMRLFYELDELARAQEETRFLEETGFLNECDYFTVSSRFSFGKVSSSRPLKWISCGTLLECSCRPMGPALTKPTSGSYQSTTALPLMATRMRLPWARISMSFQSCCLPTFLARPPSTGRPLRRKRSYMP